MPASDRNVMFSLVVLLLPITNHIKHLDNNVNMPGHDQNVIILISCYLSPTLPHYTSCQHCKNVKLHRGAICDFITTLIINNSLELLFHVNVFFIGGGFVTVEISLGSHWNTLLATWQLHLIVIWVACCKNSFDNLLSCVYWTL